MVINISGLTGVNISNLTGVIWPTPISRLEMTENTLIGFEKD